MSQMDVSEWLSAVIGRSRFIHSTRQALALSPELALDAPPMWLLPGELGREPQTVLPVACTEILADPLLRLISSRLHELLGGDTREPVDNRDTAAWFSDPLVAVTTRLLLDASLASPAATATPILEIARITSAMLGGQLPVGVVASDFTRAIERNQARLRELPPARKGQILREIGWSIAARISAAWTCASLANPDVRPNRFYQAFLRSRMALVIPPFPQGNPTTTEVMGLLDIPGDPTLMDRILSLAEAVLKSIETRMESNHSTGADLAFMSSHVSPELAAMPQEERVRRLSRDPQAVGSILFNLSELGGPKLFSQVQITKDQSKFLSDRATLLPLERACRDMLGALHRWDLFSAILSHVKPVSTILGELEQRSVRWSFVSPRSDPEIETYIVAVRLVELRETARSLASKTSDPMVHHAFDALWLHEALAAEQAGGIAFDIGSHGILLLPDTRAAITAAFSAMRALSPPLKVPLKPRGTTIDVPRGPTVSVGISAGIARVHGDGRQFSVKGVVLDEAIRLSGAGDPAFRNDDPLDLYHAAIGPDGLRSRGILVSEAFMQRHVDQESTSGRPMRLPGSEDSVAGIDADFNYYPVVFSQEEGPATVTVMVSLSRERGAPLELLRFPHSEYQQLHTQDAILEAPASIKGTRPGPYSPIPSQPPVRSSAPTAPTYDPFSDPEPVLATTNSAPESAFSSAASRPPTPKPPEMDPSAQGSSRQNTPPPSLRTPAERASAQQGSRGVPPPEPYRPPPPVPIQALSSGAVCEIEEDDEFADADADSDALDEGVLLDGTEEVPIITRGGPPDPEDPFGSSSASSEGETDVLGYLPPALKGSTQRFQRTDEPHPPPAPAASLSPSAPVRGDRGPKVEPRPEAPPRPPAWTLEFDQEPELLYASPTPPSPNPETLERTPELTEPPPLPIDTEEQDAQGAFFFEVPIDIGDETVLNDEEPLPEPSRAAAPAPVEEPADTIDEFAAISHLWDDSTDPGLTSAPSKPEPPETPQQADLSLIMPAFETPTERGSPVAPPPPPSEGVIDLESLLAPDDDDVFVESSKLAFMTPEQLKPQVKPPPPTIEPLSTRASPPVSPVASGSEFELYGDLADLLDMPGDPLAAAPEPSPAPFVSPAPIPDAGSTLVPDEFAAFLAEPLDPSPAPFEPAAPDPLENESASSSGRFSAMRASMIHDLGHVFANYHVYRLSNGDFLFGHAYGGNLTDAHRYSRPGSLEAALEAFLKDKIAEGFSLRAELVQPVPSGAVEERLDLDLIAELLRQQEALESS